MPAPPPSDRPAIGTPRRGYREIPDAGPSGFEGQLLAFAEDLREEGVALGTSEMLDAFRR